MKTLIARSAVLTVACYLFSVSSSHGAQAHHKACLVTESREGIAKRIEETGKEHDLLALKASLVFSVH
jgi:hypothetical protein